MKNSFLLHHSYQAPISGLSQEQKGELLDALFDYSITGEVPELSPIVGVVFGFFKQQMDMDAKKYEEVCKVRASNGSLGGRPRKPNESNENQNKAKKANETKQNQMKAKKANGFSENQKEAKKPDNENDNENDNDSLGNGDGAPSQTPTDQGVIVKGKQIDPNKELGMLPDENDDEQKKKALKIKIAKRNNKLIAGIKKIITDAGFAYKLDKKNERRRANLFFVSKDFVDMGLKYGLQPGLFAWQLCDMAMKHKYRCKVVSNSVTLYDNWAKIHNDVKGEWQKGKSWENML